MKKAYIPVLAAALLICAAAACAEPREARFLSLLNSPLESFDQARLDQLTALARQVTNEELRSSNFNQDFYKEIDEQGRLLNGGTLLYYWVLAYGDKHGTFDREQGEHRYLGYTALGESYTNWLFRPDFSGSIDINTANWIERPEEKQCVKDFVTQTMGEDKELQYNSFDGLRSTQKYREHIAVGLYFLSDCQPEYYKLDIKNIFGRDWENYVHILQPPSKYMFGAGRMFRRMPDGAMRYMDVPLLPDSLLNLDLSADIKEESFRGAPGEVIESAVAFELNKETVCQETARLRIYLKTPSGEADLPFAPVDSSKKLDGSRYTFQPGEKLEVRFSFTAPGGPAEIVARIDRASEMRYSTERNMANNEDRAPLQGLYDVSIKIAPAKSSFSSFNGGQTGVTFKITVGRKDSIPGDIDTTGSITGPTGAHPLRLKLGPGEYRYLDYGFPGAPGSYTVEADSWPPGPDAHPPDNRDSVTVTVENRTLNYDSKIRVEIIDN